jgi:hypothetical protein
MLALFADLIQDWKGCLDKTGREKARERLMG